MGGSAFPNYTQIPSRLTLGGWRALRLASVAGALAVAGLLIVLPDTGLLIFWEVVIPLLPLLFFVAPGLWRNICPLAASNQLPRVLGFTRALRAPDWFREYGYVIAIALLAILISLRKVVFEGSGPATAALLLTAMGAAFVGGLLLAGKSGWCTSMCPLLPVQRLYNQTPFALVPNTHCQPCVGCTKNCYDFNPRVAYLADLRDNDPYYVGYRKFFAGAFPGLVLAFFTVPGPPDIPVWEMYARFGVYVLGSVGSFYALDSFVKSTSHKITTLYAAAAFAIFYGFAGPQLVETLSGQATPDALEWAIRAAVVALVAYWVVRTYRKEAAFDEEVAAPPAVEVRSASMAHSLATMRAIQADSHQVTFVPEDKHVVAKAGTTLLEVAEANGLPIEAGCRMGICGADPVAIRDGHDNLAPMGDDERTTLERLGYAENTRMACCARVQGRVSLCLQPERPKRPTSSQILGYPFDRDIGRVVVLGNGIAGVTAADHIRRRHPLCGIDLVADEPHHLYNRMGISRLIYGRSAMQGLQLLPDSWYEDNVITTWLNTRARAIDREAGRVELATGDTLPYDRLIIATGSSSSVPPIEGFGVRGTFVLRTADDALGVRSFAQRHGCARATVVGGGLLGLEAAYALHKLGLRVTVAEAGGRLMPQQLDDRAAGILRDYVEGLGLHVLLGVKVRQVVADDGRARAVRLEDDTSVPTDLFLACAGIRPNVDLAREAGLTVKRGVVVDDHLRTSDPVIFAAGDIAEHRGQIYGLWPTAVEQAEAAADNAVGGDKRYEGTSPVTVLKVVGVELTSIGRFEPEPGDEVLAQEEDGGRRYRKLVIADGKVVGAILLGFSEDVAPLRTAITRGFDVTLRLADLRAGRWEVLAELGDEPLLPAAAARPGSG